jgi:glutaredoxin
VAAREDHARRHVPFEYVNVKKDPRQLERMLGYSNGRRVVPVIVDEDGHVTIGFGGT